MYSLKRDHSWLTHPEVAHRLYHGRCLMRDVVRAVYADQCVVGWSDPDASYHGVMMGTRPKRILINPKPVITHDGNQTELLVRTLHGVALHEAGHAVHTSPRWIAALRQQQRAFRRQRGYGLPKCLLLLCGNLAEDIWIEHKVMAEFPGFQSYFQGMRIFLFPDAISERSRQTLTQFEEDGSSVADEALVQACYNMTLFRVNRPASAAALPDGWEAIEEAAQVVRDAGKCQKLAARLRAAVAAANLLYLLICARLPPASSEEVASNIDAALRDCASPLRENASPVTRTRIRSGMTQAMAEDLRALEEREGRRAAQEEAFPARLAAAPDVADTPEGRSLLEQMTVRVLDSTADTLYNSEFAVYAYDRDSIAADLYARSQQSVGEMRRAVTELIQTERRSTEYGLREGDVDDGALADLALGVPTVFQQSVTETEIRIDLTLMVDESGSMGNRVDEQENSLARWQLAATAAILLERALRPYFSPGSLRLRVYGYTSDCFAAGETVLYRHFDSAIPRLNRPQALGWTYPKGANADGVALAAMRRELLKSRAPGMEVVLLMISDGEPFAAPAYFGSAAQDHVRQEVAQAERDGIRVTHLQVGSVSDAILNRMYGDRWRRAEGGEDIPRQVARLALRWLGRS